MTNAKHTGADMTSFILGCLKKADIPVVIHEDKELSGLQNEILGSEMLRFSSDSKNYLDTLDAAIKCHGIVAAELNTAFVRLVKVDDHDFSGTFPDAIRQAKTWALENLEGIHTAHYGKPKQFSYFISKDNIKGKLFSEKAIKASAKCSSPGLHLAVIKKLPEIIEQSLDAEIHPNYTKDENGRRTAETYSGHDLMVHRLYGAIVNNGKVYRVKTTLFEYHNHRNKAYTYEVKDMRLSDGGPILGVAGIPSMGNAPVNNLTIWATKLLENVEKSYDSGKKLLEESKKITKKRSDLFLNIEKKRRKNLSNRIYGWVKDGIIHLNKEGLNPYTPIHEYTHLWAKAMEKANPQGWKEIVNELKDTPFWEDVKRDDGYRYLPNNNAIARETLARLSAFWNTNKLELFAQRYQDYVDPKKFTENIKKNLENFWGWTGNTFFAEFKPKNFLEVSDKIFYDLVSGVNPKKGIHW